MLKNEVLIIGAGFAGSVIAREFAEKTDLPVNVIEKRKTVGGNMYDENVDGILVQKYGPHIVFTNEYKVIEYLSRFSKMITHDCKMFSYIDEHYVQLPYSYKTVQQLFDLEKAAEIIKALKTAYPSQSSVTIYELLNSDNATIKEFAKTLFEKGFKPYVAKQWSLPFDEIDESVVNRVQFQLSYVERYLAKDFQFLPEEGFTVLINNILTHKNINLQTGVDANEHIELSDDKILYDGDEYKYVFYTCAIDELFKFCYGRLPYRSMIFKEDKIENCKQALPCEICSYPQTEKFIRQTEYKYFAPQPSASEDSIVVSEYPVEYDPQSGVVQCYPIITEANTKLYTKYSKLAEKYTNLYLIGRLANYKYYNMDNIIMNSLDLANSIINNKQ